MGQPMTEFSQINPMFLRNPDFIPQQATQIATPAPPKHCGHWCMNAMHFMTCGLLKPGCCNCDRKKELKRANEDFDPNRFYSEGESDSEFSTPFNDLSTNEKQIRILFLWKKLFGRARGACLIIRKNVFQRKKISLFGVIKDRSVSETRSDENIVHQAKKAKCVILPNNKPLMYWNAWVSLLLLYTAAMVPIKVSFWDKETLGWIIFDTITDCFFLTDLVLMFFQAYERKDGTFETRHKKIAWKYLKMWFWIDMFSSLPFQLLELMP